MSRSIAVRSWASRSSSRSSASFTGSGRLPSFPFVSRFHETNVRTYVHAGGRDPGVWFFSLDASSALAVMAARALLGLPYRYARIGMAFAKAEDEADPDGSERRVVLAVGRATASRPFGAASRAASSTVLAFLAAIRPCAASVRDRIY